MKLKRKYASQDDIPSFAVGMYVESDDGEYVLISEFSGIEGFEPAKKLKQFRDTNIELKQKLESFEGDDVLVLRGDDLTGYKDLKSREQQIKDQKLVDAGQIDELVEMRTGTMKRQYEDQISSLKSARDAAEGKAKKSTSKLADLMVKQNAVEALSEVAVPRKGAMSDIMSRARSTWAVDDDGNLSPNASGQIEYGPHGDELTLEDWAKSLVTDAPHLFEESKGGGAAGGGTPKPGQKGASRTVVAGEETAADIEALAKGEANLA